MDKITRTKFLRLLCGFAIGDALGLPAEGLSRKVIACRWRGEQKMSFILGCGIVSDDTDHMIFTARSLLSHLDDVSAFQRRLAKELRWWFLGLPPGIGLATAKSAIKLWLGVSPQKAGVFSAGNGPGMRSILLGAFFSSESETEQRRKYVEASTLLTHRDPQALWGAIALAEAASSAYNGGHVSQSAFVQGLRAISASPEWVEMCVRLENGLVAAVSVEEFAKTLGLGNSVSGYMHHTVPMVLFIWLRHQHDIKSALQEAIACGGDTDTLAAFVGGLVALSSGEDLPSKWLDSLLLWPESRKSLENLADALALRQPARKPATWLLFVARNAFQWTVVVAHLLYRCVWWIFPAKRA